MASGVLQEWDEGILEEGVGAHILCYQDQLMVDPEAARVAQQLEELEGISINNGQSVSQSFELLCPASLR